MISSPQSASPHWIEVHNQNNRRSTVMIEANPLLPEDKVPGIQSAKQKYCGSWKMSGCLIQTARRMSSIQASPGREADTDLVVCSVLRSRED